tara:strand:- start:3107 stop:3655 length:549 start_codon:yes stop_codon:yes gene_type:complete
MGTLDKNKFQKIPNFLDLKEKNLLSIYCKNVVRKYLHDIKEIETYMVPGECGHYNDPLMESLLENKVKMIENITQLKLYPTYSFWRMYTYGATLQPHKDRGECEITVSVHIDGDSKWPLIIDNTELFTEAGDAIIYYGTELKHERNIFEGDFQTQVFLHFVKQNGPFANRKFDGRLSLGQMR